MKFLDILLGQMAKYKAQFDQEEGAGYMRPSLHRFQDAQRSLALYVLAMRDHIKIDLPDGMPDMDMLVTDEMIAKTVLFAGSPCVLACDAKCHKAWGSERPKLYRNAAGGYVRLKKGERPIDEDDYCHLADGELGEAPADNGWYEGGEGKPRYPDERLNKWCALQCERSVLVDVGKPLVLPDYDQRQYNCAPHTRPAEVTDGTTT